MTLGLKESWFTQRPNLFHKLQRYKQIAKWGPNRWMMAARTHVETPFHEISLHFKINCQSLHLPEDPYSCIVQLWTALALLYVFYFVYIIIFELIASMSCRCSWKQNLLEKLEWSNKLQSRSWKTGNLWQQASTGCGINSVSNSLTIFSENLKRRTLKLLLHIAYITGLQQVNFESGHSTLTFAGTTSLTSATASAVRCSGVIQFGSLLLTQFWLHPHKRHTIL